jgi:DNA-binding LacI/PurR family transcriptional regulator
VSSLPRRVSLVQETVATLRGWISGRALGEILPGELPLKQRLGVGRETLRQALEILTREGWITQGKQGQRRRTRVPRSLPENASKQLPLPVSFLSPYSPVHRLTLLELQDLQLHLNEQQRALGFLAPDIFHLRNPDRQLELLVEENPSAAWILYVVGERVQRWFDRQNVPTLLMGSPFPGVELPFVVDDWEEAAFHAGIQLVRHGHRRIAILEYWERFPGLVAEERGLERALATVNPPGQLLTFKDDRTPESIVQCLERLFRAPNRPTALVATAAAQVLTCLSWFVSRGIEVPRQVSLVALADDVYFAELLPGVTHYRSKTSLISRHISRHVMQLLAGAHVRLKSQRVAREYVPGGTVGPCPSHG